MRFWNLITVHEETNDLSYSTTGEIKKLQLGDDILVNIGICIVISMRAQPEHDGIMYGINLLMMLYVMFLSFS